MTQATNPGDIRQVYVQLVDAAREASTRSYSPYSHYRVGSALLARNGAIYTGCNVENRDFGSGICSERTAMLKAVSDGQTAFQAIAIVSNSPEFWPCGNCRQFMSEFGDGLTVVVEGADGNLKTALLCDLLPEGPTPER